MKKSPRQLRAIAEKMIRTSGSKAKALEDEIVSGFFGCATRRPFDFLRTIKALAQGEDFAPFVIWISTGETTRRLIVPHPSTLTFAGTGCIRWDHGAAGKIEFDPRHVLQINTGVNPESLLAPDQHEAQNRKFIALAGSALKMKNLPRIKDPRFRVRAGKSG